MRTALLVVALALASCSKSTTGDPARFDEITKRIGGRCENRETWRTCKSSTIDATMSRDPTDTEANPRVRRLELTVHQPTGDAALGALSPILDGLVTPAVIDGIRTRIQGPAPAVFDMAKAVTIGSVELVAGASSVEPPRFYIVDISLR